MSNFMLKPVLPLNIYVLCPIKEACLLLATFPNVCGPEYGHAIVLAAVPC
jgi:hypothetical protein